VMDSHSPSVERYRAIACPIMLLAGTESPAHPMRDAAHAMTDSLPGIRSEILVGQGHDGIRTAPAQVASLIRHFLAD
jgi:pimeloyl-ACP methyl ester carboxylesterase